MPSRLIFAADARERTQASASVFALIDHGSSSRQSMIQVTVAA